MRIREIVLGFFAIAFMLFGATMGTAQTSSVSVGESQYDSIISNALDQQLLYEDYLELGSGGLIKYREKLVARPDSSDYLFFEPGIITLNEDNSAKESLNKLELDNLGKREMNGYRIGIFFSNRATGRTDAKTIIDKCNKLFPDVATTLVYDNPYFKVHAGYATSNEEAVILLSRLQKSFPKAYIIREKIEPKSLIDGENYKVM